MLRRLWAAPRESLAPPSHPPRPLQPVSSTLPPGRNDARLDERALWLHRLLTCPVEAMASIVYPRLLPLHMLPLAGPGGGAPQAGAPLPDALPLSAAFVEAHGVYLLENGCAVLSCCGSLGPWCLASRAYLARLVACLPPMTRSDAIHPLTPPSTLKNHRPHAPRYEASVFFGKAVPPATLEGLLGAHSLEALGPAPAPLPRLATPLSAAVNALLNEVCRQRGRLLRTRVLPAGEAGELAFFSALVEDKAGSAGGSYADCLRQLHRAIVNKLS